MRRSSKIIVVSLLAAWAGAAGAITWGDKTVPDPIDAGKTCAVRQPLSWGGYIYEFPTKYDMVFWPFTDGGGLWYCEGSGYISFLNDFKDVSADERTAIAAWLKGRDKPADIAGRLAQLEGIYALRKKDPAFRNELLRTLARWYQQLGDLPRANEYRRTALAQIVARLETDPTPLPETQRLEYLYLAANYTRLFGDVAASDAWLAKLRAAADGVKDPKAKDAAGYVRKLAEDTPKIKPGGKLDPV